MTDDDVLSFFLSSCFCCAQTNGKKERKTKTCLFKNIILSFLFCSFFFLVLFYQISTPKVKDGRGPTFFYEAKPFT